MKKQENAPSLLIVMIFSTTILPEKKQWNDVKETLAEPWTIRRIFLNVGL